MHKREEALAEYVETLENLAFFNESSMANFDNCTDDTFIRWFVKDQERLLAWEGQTSCTDEFVVAFAEFIRKQAENLAAQVKDMEEKFGI